MVCAAEKSSEEPNEKNGTANWADGTKYEGEWKDYKLHGKGKMTFANKSTYDGLWHEGRMHGEGHLLMADK